MMRQSKSGGHLTAGRKSRLQRRLVVSLLAITMIMACLVLLIRAQSASLQNSSWTTGYLLMGCLFFLAAYNWRKKLSFLPSLGSSRRWMQLHIYVALVSIAIFLGHVGFQIPNGSFEQVLAALYVVVAGSGIYGLYVTRTVPRKLTSLKNEVIFEHIPHLRRQLRNRARQLVLDSAKTTDVLARYYANHLIHFFEKPRSLVYLLSPSLRHSRQLVFEIEGLDRYLSDPQRATSRKLTQLVRDKEDLDYHWALQGRLKIWLFIHVGLTYGLLLVAMWHGVMTHAFGGGLR